MSRSTHTLGSELQSQLDRSFEVLASAPIPGSRDLPIITGISPNGTFTEPAENVLVRTMELLARSQRVFRYGNTIALELPSWGETGLQLVTLSAASAVMTGAEDLLSNLLSCQSGNVRFALPKSFTDLLLRSEHTRQLPRIRVHAHRPLFDADFVLKGAGWHAEVGYLIHGPDISPTTISPAQRQVPALERLPPHLGRLLGGFCFRSNADLANTVGLLLTGVLVNHFIEAGKALALIDGNQPSLGKTLLMRVIGMILDGIEPPINTYTPNDEELRKVLCATLRGPTRSLLLVDNAKLPAGTVVSSPTLEANSVAPTISLRILGVSEIFTRPNDVLWTMTMNDTRVSPDLVSRALPIRLAYEGRPEERTFRGPDPLTYAREHRLELLGELAGMVVAWNQAGRPPGERSHRLAHWARVVGGILETAGLSEFLENQAESAASFNVQIDELAALAEAVVTRQGPCRVTSPSAAAGPPPATTGLSSQEFERYFREARVRVEQLEESKSAHGRGVIIGRFLGPNVGRQVEITVGGRTGHATLRVLNERSRGRRYVFEIVWDDDGTSGDTGPHATEPNGPNAPGDEQRVLELPANNPETDSTRANTLDWGS